MNTFITDYNNIFCCFLSALLFFLFSMVVLNFDRLFTSYQVKSFILLSCTCLGIIWFSFPFSLIPIIILSIPLVYIVVYTGCNLNITSKSYVCFIMNSLTLLFFMYGVFMLYQGVPQPIHIEDLSIFSYYKYLTFLIITILVVILFIIAKYYSSVSNFISTLMYPHLKEEIRLILFTWDEGFLGWLNSKLINIFQWPKGRYVFYFFHFLIFYLFRCLQAIFFANFVFLHGDLRLNLYLLPISFFIWILRFFEYYLFWTYDASKNYLSDLIIVKAKDGVTLDQQGSFFLCQPGQLVYEVTPFALKNGYQEEFLKQYWVDFTLAYVTFLKYKRFCSFTSLSITILNIISWSSCICSIENNLFATGPYLFGRRFFSVTRPVFFPRHARDVTEAQQYWLKHKTNGSFGVGHSIYGDTNNQGDFVAEGSLTKGPGTSEHPSHAIVMDKETGKDVGILTSAKDPKKGNINIAPENYKGDVLPNGQPKPQQFKAFEKPRYSGNTPNMVENIQATAFVKKYDKELNNAVKKANTHHKPAIARINKNSSQLYHPDGRPIFDNNGNEIDYDN